MPGIVNCSEWIGLDLRRNEEVAYEYGGVYSTHMFTQEVQNVLYNHDQRKVRYYDFIFTD